MNPFLMTPGRSYVLRVPPIWPGPIVGTFKGYSCPNLMRSLRWFEFVGLERYGTDWVLLSERECLKYVTEPKLLTFPI